MVIITTMRLTRKEQEIECKNYTQKYIFKEYLSHTLSKWLGNSRRNS